MLELLIKAHHKEGRVLHGTVVTKSQKPHLSWLEQALFLIVIGLTLKNYNLLDIYLANNLNGMKMLFHLHCSLKMYIKMVVSVLLHFSFIFLGSVTHCMAVLRRFEILDFLFRLYKATLSSFFLRYKKKNVDDEQQVVWQPDPRTLHAAEPVLSSEYPKWVSQLWIHEAPYPPTIFKHDNPRHPDHAAIFSKYTAPPPLPPTNIC
mmetsp:Transcript_3350/g.4408  ORF Transcript_3350/g.4408 Transcript_3350/m.4408 type:complete len:205 (-) Transcript_3350:1033-1647(-)